MSAILTVEEAAKLLNVRPKTVRALAAAGTIPAVKVGKPWRFDETLLREWLIARSRENVKQCPSTNVQTLTAGRSASPSLGARLDQILASQGKVDGTEANIVVLSGHRAHLAKGSKTISR